MVEMDGGGGGGGAMMVGEVVEVDTRELHQAIRPCSATSQPATCCHVPPTLRAGLRRSVCLMGLMCAWGTDGTLGVGFKYLFP